MIPTGQSLVGLDFLGIYRQTKGTSVLGLKRSGGINHPGDVKKHFGKILSRNGRIWTICIIILMQDFFQQ